MVRSQRKRTSHPRHSTPVRFPSRINAHTTPTHNIPCYRRRLGVKQKNSSTSISHGRGDDSEDSYRSLLRSIHDPEDDDDNDNDGTVSSEGLDTDASSDDQEWEWDEETTLVEMLGSPYLESLPLPIHLTLAHQRNCCCSEYSEEHVLQALSRAFADASHGFREEVVLGLRPVLRRVREARPAPGRAFIAALLGFDDACKHFEESSHRNAELNAAYAKIEVFFSFSRTFPHAFFLSDVFSFSFWCNNQVDIDQLFGQLRAAYSRLEGRRAVFQKQVKEQGTYHILLFALYVGAHIVGLTVNLSKRTRCVKLSTRFLRT